MKTNIRRIAFIGIITLGFNIFAHDFHNHDNLVAAHKNEAKAKSIKVQNGTKLVTGQGDFVFSWDKELTAKFPEDAKKHEPKMHGGFNEDPETGIVYTGIPGYGLCSISADLTEWKLLGNDPKLKSNVHGIVFFKHGGKKAIALAQNQSQKILIVDLEGKILQEISKPTGTEFANDAINKYYSGKSSCSK